MEILDLRPDQMEEAALFCTLGTRGQVAVGIDSKSSWAAELYPQGLRVKLARSGKKRAGFIEYGPTELISVRAVAAPDRWMINCLWVQPEFKGQGLGTALLQAVIDEAMQAPSVRGLVTVASDRAWLSGPGVFEKAGFRRMDHREGFSLLALELAAGASPPSFLPWTGPDQCTPGTLTLLWHPQCPYNAFYAAQTRAVCLELGIPSMRSG